MPGTPETSCDEDPDRNCFAKKEEVFGAYIGSLDETVSDNSQSVVWKESDFLESWRTLSLPL